MDEDSKKEQEWNTSTSPMWPGESHSYKVLGTVFKNDREEIFETPYGTALKVDGTIQVVSTFGAAYYEMLTHLPLCSLKNPEKVLIIGDRYGGIMQEVSRHHCVKEIHLSGQDDMVLPASSSYFRISPDHRVKYHDCSVDALLEIEGVYDAIIVDPSRPIVPEEKVFDVPFYERVARALRPGGVFCTRAESFWLEDNLVKRIVEMFSKIFTGSVNYAWSQIPMVPSGVAGFVLCSSGSPVNFEEPVNQLGDHPDRPLIFYDAGVHLAAFCIPPKFQ